MWNSRGYQANLKIQLLLKLEKWLEFAVFERNGISYDSQTWIRFQVNKNLFIKQVKFRRYSFEWISGELSTFYKIFWNTIFCNYFNICVETVRFRQIYRRNLISVTFVSTQGVKWRNLRVIRSVEKEFMKCIFCVLML